MSIIKDIRNIYSNIPKQEPPKQEILPVNSTLMDKTLDHLNKKPQIAPNITRK